MNLGQAVAVCLYELVRDAGQTAEGGVNALVAQDAVSSAELERMTALLGEVLDIAEYNRRHPSHAGQTDMRRLVRRMGVDRESAPIWMGIFRQILWKMRHGGRAAAAQAE